MNDTKGELCSCGFPQSYPIPHEHDRTERENQIIQHYQELDAVLYEALKVADTVIHNAIRYEPAGAYRKQLQQDLRQVREALAKAGGK